MKHDNFNFIETFQPAVELMEPSPSGRAASATPTWTGAKMKVPVEFQDLVLEKNVSQNKYIGTNF